jgi:hypothetical protein
MTRNRLYKVASEAVLHAGQYAYNGRKERKQQMRTTGSNVSTPHSNHLLMLQNTQDSSKLYLTRRLPQPYSICSSHRSSEAFKAVAEFGFKN